MFQLTDEQSRAFAIAVGDAMGRDDLLLAMDCIYTQLQDAIDLQKPSCDASGRCCHFEEFGHRLYVTTAEMAAFFTQRGGTAFSEAWNGRGCPHQIAERCSVHAIRPFGCRVFFCDASSDAWQSTQYERSHGQIKQVHAELKIPYFYVEWREALRAVQGVVVGDTRSTRTSLPARA